MKKIVLSLSKSALVAIMMALFMIPCFPGQVDSVSFTPTPIVQSYAVSATDIGDMNITLNNGQLNISGGGFSHQNSDQAWSGFILKYRNFIVGVSGIGAVSMIAFFIMNFLKLGASATNPSERAKILQGLIWSGLAAAGLGAVSVIVGFFYSALK